MRAALYARVSTRDKGQDVENQLRQLRQFCKTQVWEIVKEYTDRASGKRGDREQFEAMFQAASQREFDILLFWSLDRLSREGGLTHIDLLAAARFVWRGLEIVHGAVPGQHGDFQGCRARDPRDGCEA